MPENVFAVNGTAYVKASPLVLDLKVYFLTNGGTQIYADVQRNSLEQAKKVSLQGKLDGIVSEVKGIANRRTCCSGSNDKSKSVPESSLVYKPNSELIDGLFVPPNDPKKVNKILKKQVKDTAGKSWFDMPAPTLTPELKKDLQLLKILLATILRTNGVSISVVALEDVYVIFTDPASLPSATNCTANLWSFQRV
ncbi:rRNA-processing protein fcf2 [Artemisia annua]|uniref:rRNA-processing protein fcf2 n=1 Tax=Artemisia annua TaxID=35608 RepID=A0A2U1PB13_ARTAN|nr:rRNA-processing protein fcf2 [Artemisia annua]